MTNADPSDHAEKIAAYALAVADKSVDEQYAEVQSVRLRASFLLTVNALSAAFFVQLTSIHASYAVLLSLAIASFCVCNLLCVYLMMPTGNWRITKSGGKIVDDFIDVSTPFSATQAFSVLAIKTDEDQTANEIVVRRAHSSFFFAVVVFVSGTISWGALVVQSPSFAQVGGSNDRIEHIERR